MSDSAIRVENLSKRYVLKHSRRTESGDGLRHALQDALTTPIRKLRDRISKGRIEGGGVEPHAQFPNSDEVFWALQDISFEIKQGEIVGVIGRNGAGKSTLLKILSRITEPSCGRIGINGRVASLLEVGTGFHPELTGRENIYLNGAILGMTRAEVRQKFDEIVAFAEVDKFLDTPVKRYSSGMYVRLAFAVAAHLDPEILIVDEVLAVGDAEFQRKCVGKMQSVANSSGRTVLFVSHNMDAIRALCSRALLLERGAVAAFGSVSDCLYAYSSTCHAGAGSSWERVGRGGPIFVRAVDVSLCEDRPYNILSVDLILETVAPHKPAFVALDIATASGAVLMQALTPEEGFLCSKRPKHHVRLNVELPPLIPGQYSISIWVGSHYTETYDAVSQCVSFDVAVSPIARRTYPHSPEHGYIIPHVKCSYPI